MMRVALSGWTTVWVLGSIAVAPCSGSPARPRYAADTPHPTTHDDGMGPRMWGHDDHGAPDAVGIYTDTDTGTNGNGVHTRAPKGEPTSSIRSRRQAAPPTTVAPMASPTGGSSGQQGGSSTILICSSVAACLLVGTILIVVSRRRKDKAARSDAPASNIADETRKKPAALHIDISQDPDGAPGIKSRASANPSPSPSYVLPPRFESLLDFPDGVPETHADPHGDPADTHCAVGAAAVHRDFGYTPLTPRNSRMADKPRQHTRVIRPAPVGAAAMHATLPEPQDQEPDDAQVVTRRNSEASVSGEPQYHNDIAGGLVSIGYGVVGEPARTRRNSEDTVWGEPQYQNDVAERQGSLESIGYGVVGEPTITRRTSEDSLSGEPRYQSDIVERGGPLESIGYGVVGEPTGDAPRLESIDAGAVSQAHYKDLSLQRIPIEQGELSFSPTQITAAPHPSEIDPLTLSTIWLRIVVVYASDENDYASISVSYTAATSPRDPEYANFVGSTKREAAQGPAGQSRTLCSPCHNATACSPCAQQLAIPCGCAVSTRAGGRLAANTASDSNPKYGTCVFSSRPLLPTPTPTAPSGSQPDDTYSKPHVRL